MDTQQTHIPAGPGRPRGYDADAVLQAALKVFWERGYEATSLDELTSAMGISRSSFYSCFGSKHNVFVAALRRYSDAALKTLEDIGRQAEGEVVPALLGALADPDGGRHGCLLVNCITELAPHDEETAEIGRRHLARIEDIFAEALSPGAPEKAADRARALSALAMGTVTLRKSGLPPEQIRAALAQASSLIGTQT